MQAETLNTFDDIEHLYVQAYNRLVTVFNLNERGERERSLNYLRNLSDKGRAFVGIVAADIKTHGMHQVKLKVRQFIDEGNGG